MKVTFNTKYLNSAGSRVCIHDMTPRLESVGCTTEMNNYNYETVDVALFMAPDPDVIKAKKTNPKIICGVMDPKIGNGQHRHYEAADFLLVSSIEQRETFLKFNKNIFIYYMFPETKVDLKKHENKDKIIIGYHGNKVHLNNLGPLKGALDRIAEKHPNTEFHAIYNIVSLGQWDFDRPKKMKVVDIQWTPEVYDNDFMNIDIGVCPNLKTLNKFGSNFLSRCLNGILGYKYYYYGHDHFMRYKYSTNPGRQYVFAMKGIPVVSDMVPSSCQIMQDGESGSLVHGEDGWFTALDQLIQDHKKRQKYADNLYKYINENVSTDITFKKFWGFLNEIGK